MNPFLSPIHLQPGPSRILRILLGMIGLIGLATLALSPLSAPLRIVLSGILLMNLYAVYAVHVSRESALIHSITLLSDGVWKLTLSNQETIKVRLASHCLVTPYLSVLVFSLPAVSLIQQLGRMLIGKNSVILTHDNVDPTAYRRCRVRCRHGLVLDKGR